jgi:ATP-dependent Clp protease ATP-binding subunit ClpX
MALISTLDPLDVDDLVRILTEPKNALVKQYQKFFEMAGNELVFLPEALRVIAQRAFERDTGARALRAVTEELMLDLMYELPDQKGSACYVITEAIASGQESLSAARARRRKESA